MSDLKNKVMDSIDSGEIKPKPRGLFVFLKALLEVGVVIIGLATIFFLNLSFYIPKKGLGTGTRHWNRIISAIPWAYVAIGLTGLALLIWIIYKYTKLYKHKFGLIVLTIVVAAILAGFLLSTTNFNESAGKQYGKLLKGTQTETLEGEGNGYRGGRN